MRLRRKGLLRYGKHTAYIITVFFLSTIIGLGYASLSSSITIQGGTTIAKNTWDVHFENMNVKSGSVENSEYEIKENSTMLDFSASLENSGDYYSFTIDVVNNGTIDAMIGSITNTGLTEEQEQYLEYSVNYLDDIEIKENDLLAANTSETIVVNVKYKEGLLEEDLPEDDVYFDLELNIMYIQADENAKPISRIPKEYQEVEWIGNESDAYLSIPTSVYTNDFVETECSMYTPFDADQYLISQYAWGYGGRFALGGRTVFSSSNINNTFHFAFGNIATNYGPYLTPTTTINSDFHIWKYENKHIEVIDLGLSVDLSTRGYSDVDGRSIRIFYGYNKPTKGKIKSFIQKRDGIEKVNLVPCYRKNDNVVGLYDNVNGIFYTNAGTGTFEIGPEV